MAADVGADAGADAVGDHVDLEYLSDGEIVLAEEPDTRQRVLPWSEERTIRVAALRRRHCPLSVGGVDLSTRPWLTLVSARGTCRFGAVAPGEQMPLSGAASRLCQNCRGGR